MCAKFQTHYQYTQPYISRRVGVGRKGALIRVYEWAKWTFDFTGCCFLPVFYYHWVVGREAGGANGQRRGSDPQGKWAREEAGGTTELWVLLVVLGIWMLCAGEAFWVYSFSGFLGLFPLPYLMFGPCPVSISHQSHLVNLVLCSDHFGHLSDCWSGPGGQSPRKYVCGMLMSSDLLWPR